MEHGSSVKGLRLERTLDSVRLTENPIWGLAQKNHFDSLSNLLWSSRSCQRWRPDGLLDLLDHPDHFCCARRQHEPDPPCAEFSGHCISPKLAPEVHFLCLLIHTCQ